MRATRTALWHAWRRARAGRAFDYDDDLLSAFAAGVLILED